jgi:hypothetical protein
VPDDPATGFFFRRPRNQIAVMSQLKLPILQNLELKFENICGDRSDQKLRGPLPTLRDSISGSKVI